MNSTQEKQVEMHKEFFDKCKFAIDSEFYMEALLMEYAAIESRLEIILGVVGLPCNKQLEVELRKKVNISHRVDCLEQLCQESPVFQASKLDKKFFENLKKWIGKRNEYIHGLYKDELKYKQRMADRKVYAEKGYEYCKMLYSEAKRVRRVCKEHPELLDSTISCRTERCIVFNNKHNSK